MLLTFLARVAHFAFNTRSLAGLLIDAATAASVVMLFVVLSGISPATQNALIYATAWLLVMASLRILGACYRVWEADYRTILRLENRLLKVTAVAQAANPDHLLPTPREELKVLIGSVLLKLKVADFSEAAGLSELAGIVESFTRVPPSHASEWYRSDLAIWLQRAHDWRDAQSLALSGPEQAAYQYALDHAAERLWRTLKAMHAELCGAPEHFLPYRKAVTDLDAAWLELVIECEADGVYLSDAISSTPTHADERVFQFDASANPNARGASGLLDQTSL
ncbi:MAG: hypothetical protein H6918_05425 [Sphingomonadaceae bacterium]|nr:hypothetical protein [Sphingomonadaceae bacterium]